MCHKKLYVKIANNDLEILLSIFSEEMSSLSKIENLNFYSVFSDGVGCPESGVSGTRHRSEKWIVGMLKSDFLHVSPKGPVEKMRQ